MALQAKVIKPQKIKQEAFAAAFLRGADEIADEMQADFEATTATWNHKPEFEKIVDVQGDTVAVLVGTDDEIYGYVDKGTRPHVIVPKKPGGRLAFPSGYTAKTSPGVIGSRPGGSFGPVVVTVGVMHPGTEPRNFDKTIEAKYKKRFKTRMEKALQEGAKNSGHAI